MRCARLPLLHGRDEPDRLESKPTLIVASLQCAARGCPCFTAGMSLTASKASLRSLSHARDCPCLTVLKTRLILHKFNETMSKSSTCIMFFIFRIKIVFLFVFIWQHVCFIFYYILLSLQMSQVYFYVYLYICYQNIRFFFFCCCRFIIP
jgi:hypothetical protein